VPITSQGAIVLPGDPAEALHAVPKQYVDAGLAAKEELDPNRLATGEELYRRGDATAINVVSTAQWLRLVYFTARKAQTTTQVRVIGGNNAAGATPTLCEIGLFEINAAGDGTRVAATGNDTSLFATALATYTRSWLASYNMVIGQRYALSWLVVTTAAAPTYSGIALASALDVEAGIAPRITGRLTGQTTTPASFTAASVGASIARPYGVILP